MQDVIKDVIAFAEVNENPSPRDPPLSPIQAVLPSQYNNNAPLRSATVAHCTPPALQTSAEAHAHGLCCHFCSRCGVADPFAHAQASQACGFTMISRGCMRRDVSPAHSLGKPLDWDTPPRAKRDLRLHAEYLDNFHDPRPPPPDSPAQARHFSALILSLTLACSMPER